MQMHQEATDISSEYPTREARSFLAWPILLAAGWLLYELTAQPNLGAVLVCAKFGWEDFRTALWLGRADTNRRRAHACFWLYMAWALWKTALTAFLAILTFALLGGFHGPAPGVPGLAAAVLPPWFAGVLWTAWMGFGLSILTSCIAFGLARVYGIKLWLNPALHQARKANVWPPPEFSFGRDNRAEYLLISMLFLVGVLVFSMLAALLVVAVMNGRGTPLVLASFLISLLVGPVSFVSLLDKFTKGLTAGTPRECWGKEEFE
jgi:hypothetical protein